MLDMFKINQIKSELELALSENQKYKDTYGDLEKLTASVKALEERESEIQARIEDKKKDEDRLKEFIDRLNNEFVEFEGKFKEYVEKYNEASVQYSDLQEKKNILEGEFFAKKDELDSLQKEITYKNELIAKNKKDLENIQNEIEDSNKRCSDVKDEISDLVREEGTKKYNIEQYNIQIAKLNTETLELERHKAFMDKKIVELNQKYFELAENKNNLVEEINNLQGELNESKASISRERSNLESIQNEYNSIINKIGECKKQEFELNAILLGLNETIEVKRERINELDDNIQELKNNEFTTKQRNISFEKDFTELMQKVFADVSDLEDKKAKLRKTILENELQNTKLEKDVLLRRKELEGLKEDVLEYKEKITELRKNEAIITQKLQILTKDEDDNSKFLYKLNDEIAHKEKIKNNLEKEISSLSKTLNDIILSHSQGYSEIELRKQKAKTKNDVEDELKPIGYSSLTEEISDIKEDITSYTELNMVQDDVEVEKVTSEPKHEININTFNESPDSMNFNEDIENSKIESVITSTADEVAEFESYDEEYFDKEIDSKIPNDPELSQIIDKIQTPQDSIDVSNESDAESFDSFESEIESMELPQDNIQNDIPNSYQSSQDTDIKELLSQEPISDSIDDLNLAMLEDTIIENQIIDEATNDNFDALNLDALTSLDSGVDDPNIEKPFEDTLSTLNDLPDISELSKSEEAPKPAIKEQPKQEAPKPFVPQKDVNIDDEINKMLNDSFSIDDM